MNEEEEGEKNAYNIVCIHLESNKLRIRGRRPTKVSFHLLQQMIDELIFSQDLRRFSYFFHLLFSFIYIIHSYYLTLYIRDEVENSIYSNSKNRSRLSIDNDIDEILK